MDTLGHHINHGHWLCFILINEGHQHATLADAINKGIQSSNGTRKSILVIETARLLSIFVEFRNYVFGDLFLLNGAVYLGLVFMGSLMVFYNVTLAFSSFMLPSSEYRKIIEPIQDTDQPPNLTPQSFAVTSALMTVFVLFIYVPTTVYFDDWLRNNPQVVKQLHQTQNLVIETAELIEDELYTRHCQANRIRLSRRSP